MLIPLRTGRLLFPVVDIKPVPLSKTSNTEAPPQQSYPNRGTLPSADSLTVPTRRGRQRSSSPSPSPQVLEVEENGGALTPAPSISCETDYKNQGETVLVLADVKSTTVSLESGNAAVNGHAWLLESERRDHIPSHLVGQV
jgi:hypothetical protein